MVTMRALEQVDVRSLPQNLEAEMALIGAVLMNNNTFRKVERIITAESFYEELHRRVWTVVSGLIQKGQVANPITCRIYLGDQSIGNGMTAAQYLARLAAEATGAATAEDYAHIVRELALRRKIIAIADTVMANAYDAPVEATADTIISEFESEMMELRQARDENADFQDFGAVSGRAIGMAESAYQRRGGIVGISTGLPNLDAALGGLQPSDLVILAGRPGMGKAQPLDSFVKTRGRWVALRDLRVGDDLASIDGAPSMVTGFFPQGRKPVFRITFSDGRSARASGEHLWRVHCRHWAEPRVISTDEMGALLQKVRYKGRVWIDLCSGDFGHHGPLPIPPWALGVLIAHGTFRGLGVSNVSAEIIGRLSRDLAPEAVLRHQGKGDYRLVDAENADGDRPYSANRLREKLRSLGLEGARSETVFIPPEYLCASRDARLDLMRGLLDTNGWVEVTPCYTTVSERLANQVADLARSLGGLATVTLKRPWFTYNGERKQGQLAYNVWIRHDDPGSLVTLARKRQSVEGRWNGHKRLTVTSIVPDGEEECACIAVSHPSRLYITDNYVVTHNTALATNVAFNAAKILRDRRTMGDRTGVIGFSSLEMSGEQLSQRILSEQSGVPFWKIRRGIASEQDMEAYVLAQRELRGLPLKIDPTGGLSVGSLRIRARALKKRLGLELLVVDYLQLLSGSGKFNNKRVDDVTEITMGLKALAKELDVPVLALSQLSRRVEERDDKRPMLSDLRESGSIEQDADVVMFVFREEYYLRKQKPREGTEAHMTWERNMRAVTGGAQIIIGKNRHGPESTVTLGFDANTTRFLNEPEEREHEPDEVGRVARPKKLSMPAEATIAYGVLRSLSIHSRVPTIEERNADRRLHKHARLVGVDLAREKFGHEALGPESSDAEKVKKRFTEAIKPLVKHEVAFYTGSEASGWHLWLPELAREA